VLELAIAGKSLSVNLFGKLEAYPDPAPRPLSEREERFFAVSPDEPYTYEEPYEDMYEDHWSHKRSDKEKKRIIERSNRYPQQLNRAKERLNRMRNDKTSIYEKYKGDLYSSGSDSYRDYKSYGNLTEDYYSKSRKHNLFSNARESIGPLSLYEAAELEYTPVIDILNIVESIDESVAPKESIRGIILMGSAAKVEQQVTISRGLMGIKHSSLSKFIYTEKIHDVDILVLLDPKTKKKVGTVEANGQVQNRTSDGYGVYHDTRSVIGMYDIFGITTEEYEEGLHRGDFMMEHVREHGILLAGEFPYPKSDTAIIWSRSGKSKWKPKRVVKKTSLTHRRKV